ncbi:sigma factor regulatory protein, FecR/PupR family [Stenotrophomonas sp. SKA14]|uniref:FecR family protein n=1 Tax=Stenotrophomonas TaxID=40323 RepID=UPI00018FECDA|nr:FecR domain-containing protein [Stenotrophomonas sp. SKA14]EED40819.1 sigma factor regulatory protein, FecR/PupR family [Stenotrophomonas sp. SKA14]
MSQDTIAREAARWWLDGHDGDRDENAFNQWCQADPRHAVQYQHLQQLWQAGANTPSLQRQQQRRRRRHLGEAGIAVLLLCALGLYSRPAATPAAQVLRTAAGEIRDEALPDGSHVLLSPGSEVHARVDGQHRQLQLQRGQAWFKVAADPRRPFQVHTPHGTVTALGTAFDLAVQGTSSVVTVTEHRVRVEGGSGNLQAVEGQQLRFDGLTLTLPHATDAGALAWRERRLHWVSAPLAEVTQGLDRWHGGHTWIVGARLRQQPVTLLGSADGAANNRDQLATQLHVRVLRLGAGVQVWLPPRREHPDAP